MPEKICLEQQKEQMGYKEIVEIKMKEFEGIDVPVDHAHDNEKRESSYFPYYYILD